MKLWSRFLSANAISWQENTHLLSEETTADFSPGQWKIWYVKMKAHQSLASFWGACRCVFSNCYISTAQSDPHLVYKYSNSGQSCQLGWDGLKAANRCSINQLTVWRDFYRKGSNCPSIMHFIEAESICQGQRAPTSLPQLNFSHDFPPIKLSHLKLVNPLVGSAVWRFERW